MLWLLLVIVAEFCNVAQLLYKSKPVQIYPSGGHTPLVDIETRIIQYLRQSLSDVGSGVEISSQTALLGSGLLDSIGLVGLIEFLEESFSIQIPDADLGPDLFETPASIARFVQRRQS
ncbi:MAG TPA: acyl carrier protein [Devosia sp.]|nr:acyl carrier protein [Devosia sp.]